jgi:hypothetical protein
MFFASILAEFYLKLKVSFPAGVDSWKTKKSKNLMILPLLSGAVTEVSSMSNLGL